MFFRGSRSPASFAGSAELGFGSVTALSGADQGEGSALGSGAATCSSGAWREAAGAEAHRSGQMFPHLKRNFSQFPMRVASVWSTSVVRPPPPTAVT